MSCETKSVRCILHFFNVLMIIVGVFVIYNISTFVNDLPGAFIGYIYLVGVLHLLFGFLGFLGICRSNVCIMKVYAITILVSIITHVIGKCLNNTFSELIREKAIDNVNIQWGEEIQHPGAMDAMQTKYKCCGNNSPNDYINILHRPEIPKSCYSNNNSTNTTHIYKEGCLIRVQNGIIRAFSGSDKVDWAIIILTAILFGFALYLTIHFMNKKRRNNYKN